MAKNELTCHNNLVKEDGTVIPFEDLTPEEIKAWGDRAGDRMAKAFQEYFSHHPEEW